MWHMGIMMRQLIHSLKQQAFYEGQIEHIIVIPAHEPQYGTMEKPLSPAIQNYLKLHGIQL